MTTPTLRPYQSDLVARIRIQYKSYRSVLAVAPTGSGKTVIFSYIADHASRRNNTVLILAHRAELIDQISAALTSFGTPHGMIAAGYREDYRHAVQLGSVFTVAKRLDRIRPPTLIVVDEAHHAVNSTTWGKVISRYPDAKVLGVTATPVRLSGEGLRECFQTMILGPTVPDLVSIGALCPVRVFAPPTISTEGLHTRMGDFVKSELTAVTDTPTVTGDAVAHYQRHAPGKAAVAFCVSVAHAEHVAAQFKAAGILAYSVDGSLDRLVRRQIVAAFIRREIQVLTSCDIVSEGFDIPHCEVGISLRPTQSEGLWLQQCGRILRPAPGKTHALILDHAGNTQRHGFPDEVREWSLDATRGDKGGDSSNRGVRICPKCFGAMRAGTPICSYCQHVFVASPREVEQVEGELVELDRVAVQEQRRQEQGMARTREELVAVAVRRGYGRPEVWADAILRYREKKQARTTVAA